MFWGAYLENGRRKGECAGSGRRRGARDYEEHRGAE